MIAPMIFYCFERLLRIYRSYQKVTILKVRYANNHGHSSNSFITDALKI